MSNRAIIIAAFGDRRKQVSRIIKNIRSYSDLPIHIITSTDSKVGLGLATGLICDIAGIHTEFVKRLWPEGSHREGIRNSNYWKVKKALSFADTYESMCLLDDDMFVVHEGFMEGFQIAERFGAALPLNPRIYVGYNAMGADVRPEDLIDCEKLPYFASALNFSPFFICPRVTSANSFMLDLEERLRENVCRGTLAVWQASWQTGFIPMHLPEQWCVCGSNAEYIKNYTKLLKGHEVKIPIMCIHLGHKKVLEVFKDIIK